MILQVSHSRESLLPAPCSLLPVPCSLLPAPLIHLNLYCVILNFIGKYYINYKTYLLGVVLTRGTTIVIYDMRFLAAEPQQEKCDERTVPVSTTRR